MKPEILAHLYDINEAAHAIKKFIAGRTFDDYASEDLLRSAVERKFEIMGEALNRIKRESPEALADIRHNREIISFRNILAHGYDAIDDRIVWSIIDEDLDQLIDDVRLLLP